MDDRAILGAALEEARKAGADEAQATFKRSSKSEQNVDAGRMSLFRTTEDIKLTITAYAGSRKGSVSSNRADPGSVRAAAREAVELAAASEPDPANAISPAASGDFAYGDEEPDRGAMYDRVSEFLARSREKYPKTNLEQCALDFTAARELFANTNGALFSSRTGAYSFFALFTTKDGPKASSFNYSGAVRRALGEGLESWGSIDELMRQSTEQLDPAAVEGKFVGDVVITPDCLGDFVEALNGAFLGDVALIKGTSPYRDSLGARVASPLLTLRSLPRSLEAGYFVTPDGFEAADAALISGGVLERFSLSLYGSRKTGKPKSPNAGSCWSVDAGTSARDDLVAGVERGVLLCRFSGGQPSENGDFTGVAKNSYLIEGGKIGRPLSETMISGNIAELLKSVSGISRERVDFGYCAFPWVRAGGVTVSGKA